MAKRRRRRNPLSRPVKIAAAVTAVVAGGYGVYRLIESHRRNAALGPSKEGTALPTCEIGPSYPGFVQAEDGTCQPSGTTPPGIYVDAACKDFVFVSGDEGEQVSMLEKLIATATITSRPGIRGIPEGQSADPVVIAYAFLHATWPNCDWPPAADGPVRLVQMFEALCFMIGHAVVEDGGRVLGTLSADLVDDVVAARLEAIGLPPFDPTIVPELDLGKDFGKANKSGGGLGLPEPGPKQGTIDLPGGQGDQPGHGQTPKLPPIPAKPQIFSPPLPACAVAPYVVNKTKGLSASWAIDDPKIYDLKVFEFTGAAGECNDFMLTAGVCLTPNDENPFGILSQGLATHLSGFSINKVLLQNTQQQPIDWDQFRSPLAWKQQISSRIRLVAGTAAQAGPVHDVTGMTSGNTVDPCKQIHLRWPVPANKAFDVWTWDGKVKYWYAVPAISLITKGKAVFLRLEYRGMPWFQVVKETHDMRALNTPTDLTFRVHSVTEGNTP